MIAHRCCEDCELFAQIVAGTKDLPYGFCRKRNGSVFTPGYSKDAGNFIQSKATCEDFKAKSRVLKLTCDI